MSRRNLVQKWIAQFNPSVHGIDALLLVFLAVGWLLIFVAATFGLQRQTKQWLPVELVAEISPDYSERTSEDLRLARVDPKIIEAVKQEIRLRKTPAPTPVVMIPKTMPVPPTPPAATPSPVPDAFSVDAGGPYTGKEGSPVLLKRSEVNSLLRLVPGSISYRWDLDGDGVFDDARGSAPAVTFYDEGSYEVGLQVTDLLGRSATDTATIRVSNVPPLVDIGLDQTVNEAEEVQFLATARDPGRDILLYEWDFGDGDIGLNNSLRPSHTYHDNGTYLVRLRVSDNDGGVSQDYLTVYVKNLPPLVDAGPDMNANEGQPLTLKATATDPGDFDTLIYAWDLTYDGRTFQPEALGPTVSALYPDGPANTVAAVLVRDEDGGQTIDTLNIAVNNLPPVITNVTNDGPVDEGSPLTLVVDAVDVANDLLTYALDWDNDGSFEITGPSATLSNIWTNQGEYTVSIRVEDGDGGQTITTTAISTVNSPPVAIADADAGLSRPEGETINFSAGNSRDPGQSDVLTYTWNFGDGTTATGLNVSHTYADNNRYMAGLTVTDDSNTSSTDSFTITVTNANPTARAGSDKQIDEGLNILLAFDGTASSDPGRNDTLTYAWDFDYDGSNFNQEGTGARIDHVYTALDGPGEFNVALRVRDDDYPASTDESDEIGEAIDILKVTVKNLPPKGVNAGGPYRTTTGVPVTLNGSGTDLPGDLPLTFKWDFDYDGTTFTEDAVGPTVSHTWLTARRYNVALQVSDNDGGTTVATTPVDVGGPPIAVVVITPTNAFEGGTVFFDGSPSSDPDGDPLRYTWNFGDGTLITSTITATHLYADNGLYTTTLQVDDDRGGSSIAEAVVTVGNVPPTAIADINPTSVPEGEPVTLDARASSDPGSEDTLAYAWDFDYNGLIFDVDDINPITTTFYPDGPMTHTIGLRVTDDDGAAGPIATAQITVNNAPPVANAGPDQMVSEADTVRLNGSDSTDPGHDALVLFEWDLDYNGVTFTTDQTGQLIDTSYSDGPAVHTVALRVTDEDGAVSPVDTAQITVVNLPPSADAGPDQIVELGTDVRFDGSGSTDPGSDSLTFIWEFSNGITATGQIVTHTWITTGAYTVTLHVVDDDNGSDSDTTTVQVKSLAPVAGLSLCYFLVNQLASRRRRRKSCKSSDRST